MQELTMSNELISGFYIESATRPEEAARRLRPMSDVAEINAVMDEIAERARRTDSPAPDLVVGSINAKRVWANYNRRKAIGLK
jgi:hypothetical protein